MTLNRRGFLKGVGQSALAWVVRKLTGDAESTKVEQPIGTAVTASDDDGNVWMALGEEDALEVADLSIEDVQCMPDLEVTTRIGSTYHGDTWALSKCGGVVDRYGESWLNEWNAEIQYPLEKDPRWTLGQVVDVEFRRIDRPAVSGQCVVTGKTQHGYGLITYDLAGNGKLTNWDWL